MTTHSLSLCDFEYDTYYKTFTLTMGTYIGERPHHFVFLAKTLDGVELQVGGFSLYIHIFKS